MLQHHGQAALWLPLDPRCLAEFADLLGALQAPWHSKKQLCYTKYIYMYVLSYVLIYHIPIPIDLKIFLVGTNVRQ